MKNILVGIILVVSCIGMLLFLSCSQKKKSENNATDEENTIVSDDTYDSTIETSSSDSHAESDDSIEEVAVEENSSISGQQEFPVEYETIVNWATIQIGQAGAKMNVANQEKEYISLLQKNALIGYTYPFFIPHDTISGTLENVKTQHDSDERIFVLLKSFFTDMSEGSIDSSIGKYVLPEEIPVIIRQVAFSQEYGKNITEYRIGKLISAQQDRRYAKIRVFALFPTFKSRVELIMYFNFVNSNWFISAIEGDINELLVPYITVTRFEPSGTTGVTQGF